MPPSRADSSAADDAYARRSFRSKTYAAPNRKSSTSAPPAAAAARARTATSAPPACRRRRAPVRDRERGWDSWQLLAEDDLVVFDPVKVLDARDFVVAAA